MGRQSAKDVVDSVYALALETDRYEELIGIWTERFVSTVEAEGFDPHDIEDHVQRGLQILDTQIALDASRASRIGGHAENRFAIIAVEDGKKIAEMNPAASTAYGALEGKKLKSLPFDKGSVDALHRAIATCAAKPETPVQIIRAVREDKGVVLISVGCGGALPPEKPFALLRTSEFIWPARLQPALQSAFGLTPAEADIVQLMAEGHGLNEIATARQSAVTTVRAQTRSIFEKTGTHSQTELLRMAIAFAAMHDGANALDYNGRSITPNLPPESANTKRPYPRAEHLHLLDLPDGRVLEYADFGDADGFPVVYMHCGFFADVWTARAAELAKEHGLRIIAPSRPYYRRSSPLPDGKGALETHTEDMGELIKHLGLSKLILMARDIGSHFAFEIARRYPEQTAGLILPSPALPAHSKKRYKRAEANYRFLATAARRFPSLLDLFAKAARMYYHRVSTAKFIENVFPTSAADFHILDDPEILAAMEEGLALSATGDVRAYTSNFRDVHSHTYELVRDFERPIHIINGEEDSSSRQAQARALAEDSPFVDLLEIPGVGEFGFYKCPEVIIEAAASMCAKIR